MHVVVLAATLACPFALSAEEWSDICKVRHAEGNVSVGFEWEPGRRIRLAIDEATGDRRAVIELDAEDVSASLVARASDPSHAAPIIPVIARPEHIPLDDAELVDVLLKFRRTTWQVYLNDMLVAQLPPPFAPPATVSVPPEDATYFSERARYQPVTDEFMESDFMIEEGAPNPLYPWTAVSGQWQIHTALEDARERPETDMSRLELRPLTADKSPNFYSMKGRGPGAVLTTGYDFYDDYEYAAAVQVDDGQAGLVFYHRDDRHYYAFTVGMPAPPRTQGILRLYRVANGQRTLLAKIGTQLFQGQWYQPKVIVGRDEIRCFLDNIEVARVAEHLPSGGKIGLLVAGESEVRFDDIKLYGLRAYTLSDVEHIRFHTLHHEGEFFSDGGLLSKPTPPEQAELRPPASDSEQLLVLGRRDDEGAVFSAHMECQLPRATVGLVAGYTGEERPHYRFLYSRTEDVESFQLVQTLDTLDRTVAQWERAAPTLRNSERVRLMVDATSASELLCYRDGELVLMHPVNRRVTGACGVVVGPLTTATIRGLSYRFDRDDVHVEKQQENKVFRDDPFMRHWSSPEGQWIPLAEGYRYKGDCLGRFDVTLPHVPGSALHIGLRGEEPYGGLTLRAEAATLTLKTGSDAGGWRTATEAGIGDGKRPADDPLCYTLVCEDWWVWVRVGDTVVMEYRLDRPLSGTKMRTEGLTIKHLAHSRVLRYNVKDDLFTEAPYEWIANGGDWQIINRFQCTPSWSHMIGENGGGLAALWHKYIYEGDFSLEFYAGIRHGWYTKASGLNCTALATTTSANTGYTATAGEWDFDHSQEWSVLYRNGEAVTRSDAYTYPRWRKGAQRQHQNPLIPVNAMRGIHGGWYHIELRRIGSRVEYWFDNELINSFDDPDPIPKGLVGIWTFMNSMTVARVKTTFSKVRPRPFPFTALALDEEPDTAPSLPEHRRNVLVLGESQFPLDSLLAGHWQIDDPVGHAVPETAPDSAATCGVRNRLGAGTMFLESDLPRIPLRSLAGWQFDLKRTANARLNLHYSLGTAGDDGTFTPTRRLFHHLSGTTFSKGKYEMTGTTEVPASADNPRTGWHTVTAWVPPHCRAGGDDLSVRLDGFGNRQPNPIMSGLGGNLPGDTYIVRQLTPIFVGLPALACSDGRTADRILIRGEKSSRPLFETDDPADATEWLRARSHPGLNTCWLDVRARTGEEVGHRLTWVELTERVDYEFGWHPEKPGTVILRNTGTFPDPRFASATVTLGTSRLELSQTGLRERIALLPRTQDVSLAARPELEFTVDAGSGPSRHVLSQANAPVNEPPVLLSLDGLAGLVATMETRTFDPHHSTVDPTRHSIVHFDPLQSSFLRVANHELGQRLDTRFSLDFPLSRFPLLQFRYRGGGMTRLTADFGRHQYVRLHSADYAKAEAVRLGRDMVVDDAWHTWTGVATDGLTAQDYNPDHFRPALLRFASVGDKAATGQWFGSASPDQTGRHTACDLDDIVFGPAVSDVQPLRLTPRYYDADGVATVLVAISPGSVPSAELAPEAVGKLEWRDAVPGTAVEPPVNKLFDGVHHLLLKAVDTRGAESPIMDVPFLVDRKPLAVSHSVLRTSKPGTNGQSLYVRFDADQGAPLQLARLRFASGKRELTPDTWASRFVHAREKDSLILNYAYILRDELDQCEDGDAVNLTLSSIMDGAGNTSPDLSVIIAVDHAKDRTGPEWLDTAFGEFVCWSANWDNPGAVTGFTVASNNTAQVIRSSGRVSPSLYTTSYQTLGNIYRTVNWSPSKHPWLSFRCQRSRVGKGSIFTVLLVSNRGTYRIPLTKASGEEGELRHGQTFTWGTPSWQRLTFNVAEMLADAGVAPADIAKTVVSRIHFYRAGTQHREVLQIDDLFLYASPARARGKATLDWSAFDASGVASLLCSYAVGDDEVAWRETTESRRLDLAPLQARAKARDGWLRCSAKDKAGNLSLPFWIPLPADN